MSVQVKESITRQVIPSSSAAILTNSAAGTANLNVRIDKMTVTNPASFATTYYLSLWIVPSGGSANDATVVVDQLPILAGQTYGCPEVVHQVLGPGTALHWKANVASKLTGGISTTTFGG